MEHQRAPPPASDCGALARVVLSLMKLIMKNFGDSQQDDTDERNRQGARLIFYGLAFAEASLFLLKKIYWQMKMIDGKGDFKAWRETSSSSETWMEILTSLAMEDDATERIGPTRGVLRELFTIFFREGVVRDHRDHDSTAAGEALAILVLESEANCRRVLKLGALEKLIGLEVPMLRVKAARILRNFCTSLELRGVTRAVPIASSEGNNLRRQQATGSNSWISITAFKFMTLEESSIMFERIGVKEAELANEPVQILKRHPYPVTKFPRICRFTIKLAIWVIRDKRTNIRIFKNPELEEELKNVLDTTSELGSFGIFSGTVGLSRFGTTMHSLAEMGLH
ncbi:hypothetical protein Cgig2_015276 [Carnegiea gigantea]|uniref:Uncharacterized protein n=1 Tax=Carnegiea gigantea TaxID=171969 RepID=A0A9Q1K7J9_9CARY|nr:hypothetical protein Cgig2_015276 [Carnegiea gigantea]